MISSDVSPYLGIWILFSALLVGSAVGGLFFLMQRSKPATRWKVLSRLIIIGFMLIGGALILKETRTLHEISEKRQWQKTAGVILRSELRGKRGFVPFVTYEYRIGETVFSDSTPLYSPQFGSKDTRKLSTEKIVRSFQSGDTVDVFVNPTNPAQSLLEIYTGWDIIIRLGVGIFLLIGSTAFFCYGALRTHRLV
jgi:hypothetical protein